MAYLVTSTVVTTSAVVATATGKAYGRSSLHTHWEDSLEPCIQMSQKAPVCSFATAVGMLPYLVDIVATADRLGMLV
jgi:hypothetical protein